MTDNIVKYAHVAEIIDRVAIEILKVHEFSLKALQGETQEQRDQWRAKAVAAGETAEFQEQVLRDRVAHLVDGADGAHLADVLIGAVHISVGAGVVARFENMKRQGHLNPLVKGDQIAQWDGVSRDACELRGQGKSALNAALKRFLPDYDYPVEGRTF